MKVATFNINGIKARMPRLVEWLDETQTDVVCLQELKSRDAWFRMLGDGWTDAVRSRHPAGHVWTFWDYQAGGWQRDHGFRIDHLLLSPAMADRLIDAQVDKAYRGREKASDHAPTWASFA